MEKKPLEKALKIGQLNAYKHRGFWKCMDTIRDKQVIEEILKQKIMKIFITGANGYLGRNFIDKAVKKYENFCSHKKKKKKIKKCKMAGRKYWSKWKELAKADVLLHFATVGRMINFQILIKL